MRPAPPRRAPAWCTRFSTASAAMTEIDRVKAAFEAVRLRCCGGHWRRQDPRHRQGRGLLCRRAGGHRAHHRLHRRALQRAVASSIPTRASSRNTFSCLPTPIWCWWIPTIVTDCARAPAGERHGRRPRHLLRGQSAPCDASARSTARAAREPKLRHAPGPPVL